MRILAKYIYKYHIHSNTWKCSREYFMLMGKSASADAPVGNRITCLGCIYEMISMSMPACQQVCYADVEMCRCEKWKSHTTTCSFIHDLCADVGEYVMPKWRCAGGKNGKPATLLAPSYMIYVPMPATMKC